MRWVLRLAVLLAVLAAVVVGALVLLGGDDDVDTTVERRPATGALEIGEPPGAYRITYDRELLTSKVVEREVVTGRPPFDVRIERAGTLQIVTFGVNELGSIEDDRTALVASPMVAAAAPLVTADVEALLDADLAVDLEQEATVADRPCRFLRVGGALDVVPLVEPTDEEHTDVCVDEHGLVLHEEVTVAGRVTQRRTAVDVEIDPSVDDDAFTPLGERLPESLGGGRVRRMTDDSRFPDVDFFELERAPSGFEHLGRYVVANDAEVDAQGVPGNRTVGLADVYVDGTDLLVVENVRTTSSGVAGLTTDTGIAWDVDGHDGARLLLGLTGAELRTSAVRVSGNVPVDDLVEVFEDLVLRTGAAETEPYDDVEDVLDEPPAR